MNIRRWGKAVAVAAVLCGAAAGFLWADEIIEMATYIPAPTSSETSMDRLHVRRATVGSDPPLSFSLSNPANPSPPDGTLLVAGRVGIGTASPEDRLHIHSGAVTGDATTNIRLQGTRSTPGYAFSSIVGVYGATPVGWMQFVTGSAAEGGHIYFNTKPPGGNDAIRLAIREDGSVGIGTAAPAGAAGLITTLKAGNQFSADRLLDVWLPTAVDSDDIQVRVGDLILNSRKGGGSSIEGDNVRGANGNLALGAKQGVYFITQDTATEASYKMVIRNDGKVGIGTVNPAEALHVSTAGTAAALLESSAGSAVLKVKAASGGKSYFRLARGGASGAWNIFWDNSPSVLRIQSPTNVDALTIDTTGKITGPTGTIYHGSDARLKKAVAPIPNALDRVASLRGVNFRWAVRGLDPLPQMGVIGQEVEKVFPELVRTDPDGMKSVSYSQLTAALVEAVKDLKARNEAEVRRLEAENAVLRKRVETLERRGP